MPSWQPASQRRLPHDRPVRGDLGAALRAAAQARHNLWRAHSATTTAFRLVHGEADGLPGLTADVYGRHVVANLMDEACDAEVEVLDALFALGFDGVYLKRHARQKNVRVDPRHACPALPVRGTAAPPALVVEEYGVPFGVRLGDGLRTGLFLDQRENRRRAGQLARGGRLLNLFAYTGGFSVAALHGGAAEAVCVDASAAALRWAAENTARIGQRDRHRTLTGDVFEVVPRLLRRGERFDVIVVDPPTYATTKRRRFRALKHYPDLLVTVLPLLVPGGWLLACLNHHGTTPARFRGLVERGARASGVGLAVLRDLNPPPDFPSAPGHPPRFKSVLGRRAWG